MRAMRVIYNAGPFQGQGTVWNLFLLGRDSLAIFRSELERSTARASPEPTGQHGG